MDIIYTSASKKLLGVLDFMSFDCAFGNEENEFIAKMDIDGVRLDDKALIGAYETEYGGIIDNQEVDTRDKVVIYSGRTWHGLMERKIIMPPNGQTHYVAKGEANTVLGRFIAEMELGSLFKASTVNSGINIDYKVARYERGYTAIRAMLASSGAKLVMKYMGAHVVISAEPIGDYSQECNSDVIDFVIRKSKAVNHLVCLGTGEGLNRAVCHWYIGADGKPTETQYYKGVDEIEDKYELTNAELEKLKIEGREKLVELQDTSGLDVFFDPDKSYGIMDVVGGFEVRTGLAVSAHIHKKIVRIDERGFVDLEYEVGEGASSTSLSGTSESSVGRSYTAGSGISITNYTISTEVDASDLTALDGRVQVAEQHASNAQSVAAANVKTIKTGVGSPLSASRDGQEVTISHDSSGVAAGSYGPTTNPTPAFGDEVTLPPQISVDEEGHITNATGRKMTVPKTEATQELAGLMSKVDKTKLDGVSYNANNYALPKATESTLGGVKVDDVTIKVRADGTIYAELGGAASFLAAHPPGSEWRTKFDTDPNVAYGGVWTQAPSLGAFVWYREE